MRVTYWFPISADDDEEYEYEITPYDIKHFLDDWVRNHDFEECNELLEEEDKLSREEWEEMEVEDRAEYLYERDAHEALEDEIKDFFEDEAQEEFEDMREYEKDPLGYCGMSLRDFY